mmetsp:Transcript_31575/g.106346  ORF Transcript_31575/g.106346 Transcript_31575/m.106346 type:complete len:309 (+) Transcript_31575:349-1275(+)
MEDLWIQRRRLPLELGAVEALHDSAKRFDGLGRRRQNLQRRGRLEVVQSDHLVEVEAMQRRVLRAHGRDDDHARARNANRLDAAAVARERDEARVAHFGDESRDGLRRAGRGVLVGVDDARRLRQRRRVEHVAHAFRAGKADDFEVVFDGAEGPHGEDVFVLENDGRPANVYHLDVVVRANRRARTRVDLCHAHFHLFVRLVVRLHRGRRHLLLLDEVVSPRADGLDGRAVVRRRQRDREIRHRPLLRRLPPDRVRVRKVASVDAALPVVRLGKVVRLEQLAPKGLEVEAIAEEPELQLDARVRAVPP